MTSLAGYHWAVGSDAILPGFRYEACYAAAVVEDATLAHITDELLARDWAPKVHSAGVA